MTPRRPTPHSFRAFCALRLGVLTALGLVGCTDPPAAMPDAARKDVTAETVDLDGDALADAPDAPTDVRSDRADARADVLDADALDAGDAGPEVVFEDVEFLTGEDVPPGYDIQLDRSGDALTGPTLVPLDVSEFYTDRPVDGGPRVPCTPSAVEVCACVDGREGWQVCEADGRFSTCMCDTLPAPPFALPPRLVFPPNGSRVTSQRPTVRWAPPMGVTRARVELCADRPCATVLVRQEVADTAWRPTARLAPRVVFWRVQGLGAGGTVVWTSATWYFQVRARDSAVDTAYGNVRDFNGDGYDDLVVAVDGELRLFLGSPMGLGAEPAAAFRPSADGARPSVLYDYATADMTGDGLADLAVEQAGLSPMDPSSVSIYAGDARLPLGRRVARLNRSLPEFPGRVTPTDHDGDGYPDLVLGRSMVFRGGPGGGLWRFAKEDRYGLGTSVDLDRDGYMEYFRYSHEAVFAYGRLPMLGPQRLPIPDPGLPYGCPTTAGDFNGDQFGDIVGLCRINESMDVSRMSLLPIYGGQRALRRSALRPVWNSNNLAEHRAGAQGDVDGDGYVDLVVANSQGGVYWFRGGSGGLSDRPHVAFETASVRSVSNVGDLDGDGDDETAIVRCDATEASVTILDGAPTWSGASRSLWFSYCPSSSEQPR